MTWLPIPEYEGIYEISDKGEIRSTDRWVEGKNGIKYFRKGVPIKLNPNKQVEYLQASLWKNNKGTCLYVHRLVASTFIPNKDNLPEVNHIDGNRLNNTVDNLEWVSRQGNARHAVQSGLRTYENRLTEEGFLNALYQVIKGKSYLELSKELPYKVSFLSTKVRKLARKFGIEDELDYALERQEKVRKKSSGETMQKLYSKPIAKIHPDTEEVIEIYPSVAEAFKSLTSKTSTGSISNAALGRQQKAGGFKWKYI